MYVCMFFCILLPEPLASSVSATSLSALSGAQRQPTLPKLQTINLCHKISSRNLEELNLFFDQNNDLCERMSTSLLLVDDGGGVVVTKSPEVSDHIQFLITEVPGESDANGGATKKDKDDKETCDDCDLVASGEY